MDGPGMPKQILLSARKALVHFARSCTLNMSHTKMAEQPRTNSTPPKSLKSAISSAHNNPDHAGHDGLNLWRPVWVVY